MRVVSNTTPLHYLILIEAVSQLEPLFGRILIPSAVSREVTRPETPPPVRAWMRTLPAWVEVHPAVGVDSALKLGAGEREAIFLAEHRGADLLLLDDMDARRIAETRGLRVIGTLGVLERAAQQDLLDLPQAIVRLRRTNFRAAPGIYASVLCRKRERRGA